MNTSFYTAARGVMTQQEKMNLISNNVANVNTVGYKNKQGSFQDLFYYNMVTPEEPLTNLTAGAGAKLDHTNTDYSDGGLLEGSDKQLNFAITGEGFFATFNPTNGETAYTRNGIFSWSLRTDGFYLVNDDGNLVLDANGNSIVQVDGQMNQTPGVFTFENTDGMLAISANEFVPIEKNGPPTVVQSPNLQQGYVEASNVDLAQEMANIVETSRAYSYVMRMVTTSDEVQQTINNLRG